MPYDPADPASVGDPEPYLNTWRTGGDPAVAAAYPGHEFIDYMPDMIALNATPEELYLAEHCLNLSGPLYDGGSTCSRATQPGGLPPGTAWPAVEEADCIGCVRFGDNAPPP